MNWVFGDDLEAMGSLMGMSGINKSTIVTNLSCIHEISVFLETFIMVNISSYAYTICSVYGTFFNKFGKYFVTNV